MNTNRTDSQHITKPSQKKTRVQSILNLRSKDISSLLKTVSLPVSVGDTNCENFIGSVEIPVGVAGPVVADTCYLKRNDPAINYQKKEYIFPLATSEAALVASVNRGSKALAHSMTSTIVRKIGISRSVAIECSSTKTVFSFLDFFKNNLSKFVSYCQTESTHLTFISYDWWNRGRIVYIRFVFDTQEAMGMNMITIALQHGFDQFLKDVPKSLSDQIKLSTISANVCTDKKDAQINRLFGRGYVVSTETLIPRKVVKKILHTTPEELVRVHTIKNLIGSNIAGSASQNMQVANVVAAFFLATGQDCAHAVSGSEASVSFELDQQTGKKVPDLYVSLTMPHVCVGTVGGGTHFLKQSQARSLILNDEQISACDLAAAVSLASLCAEISGLAALTTGTLAKAHHLLSGRKNGISR